MDKIIKISMALAILIITFSVFYYFVLFLPSKNKAELEQQEEKYKACLQKCDVKYAEKLNLEAFGKPDYYTLFKTCNLECREKYAKPLPELPKLPEIDL